jgi:ABC-type branched-subunit amino acid transport system ATPase component
MSHGAPLADPLVVSGVTVDFGGVRALDDISLVARDGRITGLIGPNGAGKTTLFDCVSGLVAPSSGRIELFGTDVTGWPLHDRARLGLGRTFQRLELFGSLTVEENLVVALEAASSVGGLAGEIFRRPASIDVRHRAQGRAVELLELVGLTQHARSRAADLPIGLGRVLDVARTLATEPKLLMLDEPSSGLNDEETARLAGLLRTLQRERDLSMLIVEHDMDFVLGLSSTAYVLDFGKLLARGSPDELRADARVRAAYLGDEVTDHA